MDSFSALEGEYSTANGTDPLIRQISSGTNGYPINDFQCSVNG